MAVMVVYLVPTATYEDTKERGHQVLLSSRVSSVEFSSRENRQYGPIFPNNYVGAWCKMLVPGGTQFLRQWWLKFIVASTKICLNRFPTLIFDHAVNSRLNGKRLWSQARAEWYCQKRCFCLSLLTLKERVNAKCNKTDILRCF